MIQDPRSVVGNLVQSISDIVEEEGFVYLTGVALTALIPASGVVKLARSTYMAKIYGSHVNLSLEQIEIFENENNIKLTEQYINFLLKWNGGKVVPNLFMTSNEQGSSVLNVFYGIGDMYDNLTDFIEIMYERLPEGFIPIGDDPSGNVICLGTKNRCYDKVYFWDHEQEPENPDDMSNMYFLANDIYEFLDNLYEDTEE